MAHIELVIKIPERIHYGIEKGITVNGSKASQILIDAVKNGTPLPKGHDNVDDFTQIDDDFNYIIDTAKEMGMTVTYVTPINVKFIAELIRRLKEKVEVENGNDD